MTRKSIDDLRARIEDEDRRRLSKTGRMSRELFTEFKRSLENIHVLYYRLVEIGAPVMTYAVRTACVIFDKTKGRPLQFLFNPDFYDSLDSYTRSFVGGHEMLHILLEHGRRTKDYANQHYANIAADIVVNHMLVDKFGFYRKGIHGWESIYWVDTTWPGQSVQTGMSLEYYYQLLLENPPVKSGQELVDDHDFMHSITEDDLTDLVKRLASECSPAEKKMILEALKDCDVSPEAGDGALGMWAALDVPTVKPLRKWETVITKWVGYRLKMMPSDVEHWKRESRRIDPRNTTLILPARDQAYDFTREKGKMPVLFFLDTSGSCWELKDRFYQAMKSIPRDRFEVRIFSFDTQIYPLDVSAEDHVIGGGGTSFSIIESHIQSMIHSGDIDRYPEAVWVMTDGFGDVVHPEKPKNWYWFLSTTHEMLIPIESKRFALKDFE